MVGPDSEGIWYLLYQFYQLVLLLALIACGFVVFLISTKAPRKKPVEEEQNPAESNVPETKIAAVDVIPVQMEEPVTAMVRNRSETLLVTKEMHEKMAEEFEALQREREMAKTAKTAKKPPRPSFEADADDEEEEEEEEDEDVEPTPSRRRRIIGEVTVQKVVFPAQSQYSDSQITAAREMIRKSIDRKLMTCDENEEL